MQKVYTVLLLALLVLTPIGLPRPVAAAYATTAQSTNISSEVVVIPTLSTSAARVSVQVDTAKDACTVRVGMDSIRVQQTVDIEALWACDAVVVKPVTVIETTHLVVVNRPAQHADSVVLAPAPERISVGFVPWYPETQPSALLTVSGSENSWAVRLVFTNIEQAAAFTRLSIYVPSKTLAQLGSMLC